MEQGQIGDRKPPPRIRQGCLLLEIQSYHNTADFEFIVFILSVRCSIRKASCKCNITFMLSVVCFEIDFCKINLLANACRYFPSIFNILIYNIIPFTFAAKRFIILSRCKYPKPYGKLSLPVIPSPTKFPLSKLELKYPRVA